MYCFFFKQKTAYEMRIRDWSSDVCSSDLLATGPNLHYEVLAKETPLNPVKLDLPPRRVLTGEELARFQSTTAEQIDTLPKGDDKPKTSTPNAASVQANDDSPDRRARPRPDAPLTPRARCCLHRHTHADIT